MLKFKAHRVLFHRATIFSRQINMQCIFNFSDNVSLSSVLDTLINRHSFFDPTLGIFKHVPLVSLCTVHDKSIEISLISPLPVNEDHCVHYNGHKRFQFNPIVLV